MSKRQAPEKLICPEEPKRSNLQEQASPCGNGNHSLDSEESGFQDNEVHSMDVPEDVMPQSSAAGDSEESGFQDNESMDVPEDVVPQSSVAGDSDSNSSNSDSDCKYPLEDVEMPFAADCMRDFAENVLSCNIKIGKEEAKRPKNKKKQTDSSNENSSSILEKCCALYNAGGGVLQMRIVDFADLDAPQSDLDRFWKTIEQKLKTLIDPLSYVDVFDRKFDSNSDTVYLFIKNVPNHFCTLKFNLSFAGDSGIYDASYTEAINIMTKPLNLKKKRHSEVDAPLNSLPKVDEEFVYGERVSFHESKQIQLKHYTCETILVNHEQCDIIRKTMSSFANANGGVIYLGITDKGIAYGQNLERDSTEAIEERVQSLINKMYWSVTPRRGDHWDVKFFPLVGKKNQFVIAIYVAGMQSSRGVFAKCPVSVELRLSEDGSEGQVHRLDFDEWKQRMVGGTDVQTNSKGMEDMLKKFSKMHVSKGHLLTVKGDVQRIKDAFFIVKEGFPVLPEGFESNLPEEAQVVIKKVQQQCSRNRNRGLLVAAHSWLGNTGGTPIDGVVCDLLLVSRDMGGLHLFTLCHNAGDEKFLHYSREAAQSTKRSLVENGACGEKFYVSYHVVSCTEAAEIELALPDSRYPRSYDLKTPREKLNEVLKAMVLILAAVPSTLSNKLGVSILNLLTMEQFKLIHQQIEINRELWIKGIAGTGKTLVAVEFMRELLRREKLNVSQILCVCENEGIANQIRKSNVCNVVCRQTFMRDDADFPNVKHVVMDEVHNYEQPVGTDSWVDKARHLVRQHDPKNPGYLWFFTDKCQSNHVFPSGIPGESEQKPQFRLTRVIRNSRKIFNRAKKYITQGDVGEMGHDFEGENVEVIEYSKAKTTELGVLNKTFHNLLKEGYREGDIAILFETGYHIPDSLFRKLNRTLSLATDNDSDYLVVSSVLKYSGLDRPVVVLVNVHVPRGRIRERFFYCGETRAMVKLIIIKCK